ncbi:MAG: c-type cytochrome, partial [Planctomycetota bacterium]|nr:c-type cytochrome [Planctomycetota bacterium]
DTRAGEELGRIWRVVRDDDPLRARRENGVTRDLAEQTGARTTTPAVGPGALTLDGSADPYERFVVLARALGDLNGLSRDQVLALREDPSFLVAAHRRMHDAGGVKAATAELIDTAADWQRLGMELSDSAALPFVGILGCELAFLEGERDLVRRLLLPTGVPDLRRAVLERALQVAAFRDLVEEARAWLPPADLALLEPVAVVPAPTPDEVQAERRRLDGVAALFGNASRGRAHFEAKCATCHRLDDVGEVVGSDLAALTDTSTDVLLTALLEPSRDLYPQFQDYALRTTDGRVFGGMFQDEGPSFVRLRGVDGQVHTAARSEIDALVATGRSFMPAGLVADLTPQEVADLLAFVRAPRTPPKQLPGNEPAPVRRDAHGQWHMTASAAAVYGPELIYEQPTRNLGYWHSAQDHATWQVLVPEEVTVDVWVEFACADSSAGGTWLLEGAGQVLRGEVPGTGPDWSRYVRARVGRLTLPAGEQRFVCRAEEDPPRSLLDLRRFSFVPPGEEPGDE